MIRSLADRNCIGSSGEPHQEYQYHELIKNIRDYGVNTEGRNGVTRSVFGATMCFDLGEGIIPLLTTKRLAWKTCLKELLWFLSGSTSNKDLNDKGVHIWDGNSSKEYLETRGLDYTDGELGPIYGHQWRSYNGEYPSGKPGVDQIKKIIDQINSGDKSHLRRLILSAWNPEQLDQMALPPCHILSQFDVTDNKLSCMMFQRSADVGLGLPFNIASYAFLTHILAIHCGLEPGELIISVGNAHIYQEHLVSLLKQVERTPFPFPTLSIKRHSSIDDYSFDDFTISDYVHHPSIKMQMRP